MATEETSVGQKRPNPFPASRATWPLVGYLLLSSCPTAIFRRVIPVVVNAVQRMLARWLASHIGKKVLEFLPALTHHNATRSVVFPIPATWISTAFKHSVPRIIFRPSPLATAAASMKAIHAADYTIEVRCT